MGEVIDFTLRKAAKENKIRKHLLAVLSKPTPSEIEIVGQNLISPSFASEWAEYFGCLGVSVPLTSLTFQEFQHLYSLTFQTSLNLRSFLEFGDSAIDVAKHAEALLAGKTVSEFAPVAVKQFEAIRRKMGTA